MPGKRAPAARQARARHEPESSEEELGVATSSDHEEQRVELEGEAQEGH